MNHDLEPRDADTKDTGTSSKSSPSDFSSLDFILLDKTGPIQVTLIGDELVSAFRQQVNATVHTPKIVSLSLARISNYQQNDRNGNILTSMRLLQSISPTPNQEGTILRIVAQPSSICDFWFFRVTFAKLVYQRSTANSNICHILLHDFRRYKKASYAMQFRQRLT